MHIETPCLVVDVEIARKNIERMQKSCNELGVRLRPHIKTHKMPLFAEMQLAAGAAGITCAKVSEAEIMTTSTIVAQHPDGIFIAYPLIGDFRIRRAIALQKKVRRLILAVDSIPGATALNEAALAAGVKFEVRMELDTGAKRTGVLADHATDLALAISALPGLKLTGIYTFKSLNLHGEKTADNAAAGKEEGDLIGAAVQAIAAKGISLEDISGGSSPTGLDVARSGKVNEIRPGTYIFNDIMLCKEGVSRPGDIAVKYYATVVSTPEPGYAVLDGGTKCFPTDQALNAGGLFTYDSYALPLNADGTLNSDLKLDRMNEEHGIIRSLKGNTGLSVGQTLCLYPIHVCTAINMHNTVYLLENGALCQETVAARGMLV
jgi:D-serine deaminase-like pyridoxal phosphate-dependent protein